MEEEKVMVKGGMARETESDRRGKLACWNERVKNGRDRERKGW